MSGVVTENGHPDEQRPASYRGRTNDRQRADGSMPWRFRIAQTLEGTEQFPGIPTNMSERMYA